MRPTPRRVLLVTAEAHPTFRADVRVLFGRYLPRLGIASDLFALATPQGDHAPWPAGHALLAPPPRGKLGRALAALRHDLRLFRQVRQGYDAVIVRDRILGGLIARLACALAGVPWIYWASFAKPESRLEFAQTRRGRISSARYWITLCRGRLSRLALYRVLLPGAGWIFVQSEAMRRAFAAAGAPLERMTSVPMGVDLEEIDAMPDAEGADRPGGFVYLGDLSAVRRPELMIEAVAIARRECPGIRLTLVGDALEPADRRVLDESIRRLGLDDVVTITGWMDVRRAQAIARQSLAGISLIPRTPILDLSSPTKIVEYLALGIPVLANDSPDQAALLAAIGGSPVPCTAEGLAAGMIGVVRHPETYRELARRGRAHVAAQRSYDVLARRVAGALAGGLWPEESAAA